MDNLTPEERDARTVFCMQLAARIRPRDLEEFFSAVGKVRHTGADSTEQETPSQGFSFVRLHCFLFYFFLIVGSCMLSCY